jgi:exo-beta-1,3-glucanase (GH17 family)
MNSARKRAVAACAFFSLLTYFIWAGPNHPQAGDIAMPAGKIDSLSYAPYGPHDSPLSKTYETPAQVARDLAILAPYTDSIRTYSAIQGPADIPALAQAAGLHEWAGIWLSGNPRDNRREMDAGIAQANAHPDAITRVIVGNEVLLRRDLSVADLEADLDYVRARVKQPVAYADVTDFWNQFPDVANHVDIVMIHILPYWEDKPLDLDAALASIRTQVEHFKTLFPHKIISIGETGWPSRGRWRGPAAPSRINEAVYVREVVALAAAEHVDYNLIEAFDQPWKYEDEGVAGANWGIWNADRQLKFPLSGAVTEHPSWPWYAALAALTGTLLYLSIGGRTPRLAMPAFALGNGFALACMGTLPLLYDHWLALDALINLPLQALLAVLALRRADAILNNRALPAPTSAAQTLAAWRRLRPLWTYHALTFLFLASAAVFEALLVFDGRYREAPIVVFIIPTLAAVLALWTHDKPALLAWEDILAANTLALLALINAVQETPQNLEFLIWTIAALIIAAPVVLAMQGKRGLAGRHKLGSK